MTETLENNPLVEVWVLSRNRPAFLIEMLDSLRAQDYANLKVIVSENSTDNSVFDQIYTRQDIEIHRRNPPLESLEHFELVLSQLSAPFSMILHDDDIAEPHMVKTLVQNINRYPGCVAICANAFVIDGKDKTENLLSKSIALEPRVIRTPSTLARRYISEDYNVSPFPGYMYRSTVARECRKSMTAIGRVSDVSFLCTLLSHGGILQIGAPLLRYRLHAGQDTHNIALRNKVSLIRWFLAKGILKKSDPIVRYARLRNLVRSPKFPTKKDKTRMERRRFIAINSFFLFLISPQMLIRFCLNKIKKRLK